MTERRLPKSKDVQQVQVRRVPGSNGLKDLMQTEVRICFIPDTLDLYNNVDSVAATQRRVINVKKGAGNERSSDKSTRAGKYRSSTTPADSERDSKANGADRGKHEAGPDSSPFDPSASSDEPA